MANEPKRRIASQTKQTLEKVYFYIREEQRKEEIVKKQTNKQTKSKQARNIKQGQLCLFSVIAVSQYLC